FHSATRAYLIIFPPSPSHFWIFGGLLVFLQVVMIGIGVYFMTARSDNPVEPAQVIAKVTLTESVWFSCVESSLFYATQFKIVEAVINFKTLKDRFDEKLPYKSELFNITVVFLAIGGYFKNSIATSWIWNGMSVCLLIIMTDAIRFKNALELLRYDKSEEYELVGTLTKTFQKKAVPYLWCSTNYHPLWGTINTMTIITGPFLLAQHTPMEVCISHETNRDINTQGNNRGSTKQGVVRFELNKN
ncbi:hypothetical protein BJ742DRAFT_906399, partial [Cladochytrium replicatum]